MLNIIVLFLIIQNYKNTINFNSKKFLEDLVLNKKITITQLALYLECSTRTIHRNIGEELKREKELLNKQL